jgi:hypothetical protein
VGRNLHAGFEGGLDLQQDIKDDVAIHFEASAGFLQHSFDQSNILAPV